MNSLSKFQWLSSSTPQNWYIFTNFSAFSASKLLFILDHTKLYVEKTHSIDDELAGHAHKLDMNQQSLCGSGFSLFTVRMVAKPYHFGMNWPATLVENKDCVHFFTFHFECRNRHNKLYLYNSENCDIAWCNKNNSEWGFSVFLKNITKSSFFLKNKNNIKKNKSYVGWENFFF